MSEEGWDFVGSTKRRHVTHIAQPYVHDSEQGMVKHCFCIHKPAKASLSAAAVSKWYLVALLTADTHKLPVPHFETVSVYHSMVDGDWRPKAIKGKKRQEFIDVGEWEAVSVGKPRCR